MPITRSVRRWRYMALGPLGLCWLVLGAVAGLTATADRAMAGTLTLDQAIAKAMAFDPRLKSQQAEAAALEAETYQASLSPNPELSAEVENFLGSGAARGFGAADITVSLEQRFELGGKRAARIARGQAAQDYNAAQLRALRRAVVARVSADFFAVLGARKKLQLRKAQRKQFRELLRPLKERVEAGGSPEADLTRGQIALDEAVVALETAAFELEAARRKLAANWSGSLNGTTVARGRLRLPSREAMPLASILGRLKSHPELKQFEALHSARLAELGVQESLAVPDLTLGIGVRRLGDSDDVALVAQGSIPLPLRDRNEGAITAAAERVGKVAYERDVVWQSLKRRLIAAYGRLHKSCHETRRYATTIVPRARATVASIKRGYFRGRFKVVDLLDAISVLTEAESRQGETLVQCQIAAVDIKTLTGIDPFNGRKLARYAR